MPEIETAARRRQTTSTIRVSRERKKISNESILNEKMCDENIPFK